MTRNHFYREHKHDPGRRTRRFRPWAAALITVLMVSMLVAGFPPSTGVARAAGENFPPPELLNAYQLSLPTSIYAATSAQQQSLQALQQAAVSATVADHGLASGDATAVKTWGRGDAEAELWALILEAIRTAACTEGQTPGQGCRTTEQQNAVDWLAAVNQHSAVQTAEAAGREYVKWAGLDQSAYQALLNTAVTQSSMQSFLCGGGTCPAVPLNYNSLDHSASTGGFCVYRPPAPYQNEYSDAANQSCGSPCTSSAGCIPTGPTYDQLVKWGAADVNYGLYNSAAFKQTSNDIALGVGFGVGTFAGVAGTSAGIGALVGAWSHVGYSLGNALLPFAATTGMTVAAVAGLVLIAVAAAIVGGFYAVYVINAAELPGKLASLIVNTRATTPDLAPMLDDSTQLSGLFALFVGATMPAPLDTTCDNSNLETGVIGNAVLTPCLNKPPVPSAASTDSIFTVQAKDAAAMTYSKTISLKDAGATTSTTTRLSGNWFVQQVTDTGGTINTVQTLRQHYTDWDGKGHTAWLVHDPDQGYGFLMLPDQGPSDAALNPSTCVADKTCAYSSTIHYVDADGNDESASVIPAPLPTVTVTTGDNPVEGSPVNFSVSGSSPVGLPLTYTWQFQGPNLVYSEPISGTQASYTWQTAGTFDVLVTATDSIGTTTRHHESVSVAGVAPILSLLFAGPSNDPGCLGITPCQVGSAQLGTAASVNGWITHAGSADQESVEVDWGDGKTSSIVIVPPPLQIPPDASFSITRSSSTLIRFSALHNYANIGHYTVWVTATDQTGAASKAIAAQVIWTTPTLSWPTPAAISYGTALGSAQLNAMASDAGSSTVPGSFAYSVDGSPFTPNQVLSAGKHTLTASFTATNSSLYHVPDPISVDLTVNPVSLVITANDKQMSLHGTVPSLPVSYSGFVNGDTPSALTTPPTCSTTATGSSLVGTYPISCSGAVDPNYTIAYKAGMVAIHYVWSGFQKPINDPVGGATTLSVFKAGSTVGAKFQLKDAKGVIVQAGSLPTFSVSALQPCAVGSVNQTVSTTAGSTGTTYRWDSSANQYVYTYKSLSNAAGMCQYIQATLDDGTTQKVLIAYH